MAMGLATFRTRPEEVKPSEQAIFALDDWGRLNRFLILGSEAAKYSASGKNTPQLVEDNAKAVIRCIESDGMRVVNAIIKVSDENLAPKNDPALFALALVVSFGDEPVRKYALDNLGKVARIGTHVLMFAKFCEQFRGWGRGLRRGVGACFNGKDAGQLAYQLVKYQGRGNWTMRDVLRLTHPIPPSEQHKALYHWVTQGWDGVGVEPHSDDALKLVWAFESLKQMHNKGQLTAKDTVRFITDYNMPREAIPTEMLKEAVVWEALLEKMPMTAMIRNLATMTRLGVIAPLSAGTAKVIAEIGNVERIRKSRVHPMSILIALKQYSSGSGFRSDNVWTPVNTITNALDAAFYSAFKNVVPSNKRFLLALDVSSSMEAVGTVAGVETMSAREVSAAMALITAATEPQTYLVGFSSGNYLYRYGLGRKSPKVPVNKTELRSDGIAPIDISPSMRLDQVIDKISGLNFGSTDCSLPMVWAKRHKIPVDVFSIYTDSETNSGRAPMPTLREYRKAYVADAKMVVVATQSTDFTVGDPNDPGVLNVAGFDSSAPAVISEFAKGNL